MNLSFRNPYNINRNEYFSIEAIFFESISRIDKFQRNIQII